MWDPHFSGHSSQIGKAESFPKMPLPPPLWPCTLSVAVLPTGLWEPRFHTNFVYKTKGPSEAGSPFHRWQGRNKLLPRPCSSRLPAAPSYLSCLDCEPRRISKWLRSTLIFSSGWKKNSCWKETLHENWFQEWSFSFQVHSHDSDMCLAWFNTWTFHRVRRCLQRL